VFKTSRGGELETKGRKLERDGEVGLHEFQGEGETERQRQRERKEL